MFVSRQLGGFGMPFFVLGIAMVVIVPLNLWMLPTIESKYQI